MILHVLLRDGRTLDVEAEGKSVGTIAEIGATQTDEHRGDEWTLWVTRTAKRLDRHAPVADCDLQDGDTCELRVQTPSLLVRARDALRGAFR